MGQINKQIAAVTDRIIKRMRLYALIIYVS